MSELGQNRRFYDVGITATGALGSTTDVTLQLRHRRVVPVPDIANARKAATYRAQM
jgi:hypothetical protein